MDLKAYLSELEYLVNIDSGSDYPEGIAKVADFFRQRYQELGWQVQYHDLAPKAGPCLICTNREAEHYDLMLMGHMDTVFPTGTCAQWPFHIDGDCAYGPGVGDMKDGCLLMYYLMKDIPKEVLDKLNIVVVYNPDEEIGSAHSQELYIPYAKKADYAFIYEGASTAGNSCIQRKGGIGFQVEFTGVPGHCGYVFKNGARSAISEMAKWVVELDKLQSKERETTVNVGIVSGGTKNNVVAEHAVLSADVRFALPEEKERVFQTLEELKRQANARGIGVEIKMSKVKQPLNPTPEGLAYVERMIPLLRQAGLDPKFVARGGLSDANIIAQYGPICVDGIGPRGDNGHRIGELIYIDSIEPMFRFSEVMIRDLADRKDHN